MKKLLGLLFFPTIILCGCGGDSSNKTPPPTTSSSSSSSLSPLSSSSSVVTSSSSSIKSSSSSLDASSSSSQAASSIPFTITSNSFVADSNIPIKYSCYSSEVSPHLKWDISSDAIKSFVLIMEDKDATPIFGRPYVHWNVYNIPASTREITEGATLRAMPAGSIEGTNDDNVPKYAGPCPPQGSGIHHYYFSLYALNQETLTVNTGKAMMRSEFETKFANQIITKTEIIGLYKY